MSFMPNIVPQTIGLNYPGSSNAPKATFAAKDIDALEWKGDLLAVGVTEKDVVKDENSNFKNPLLHKLDAILGGLLDEAFSKEYFSGKSGQSVVLTVSGLCFKRVGLFGLGQSASSATDFDGLGETIAAAGKTSGAASVAVALAFSEDLSDESKPEIASIIAVGIANGIFDDDITLLRSVDILGLGSGPDMDKKLKYAQSVSSGIMYVEELENSPANVLTTETLTAEVLKLTQMYNDVLSARIFDGEEIIEVKMGSFLGDTANPPKFIHLCYKPPSGPVSTKLGLAGKGITFDSGGFNLKTGGYSKIELLKNDMGGASTILGAAKSIAEIKPLGVEVHFVVPASKNMISATGSTLNDIATTSNENKNEVNNKGRFSLALIHASKQDVDKNIELPTLTDAWTTARGPAVGGVFKPTEHLGKKVTSAAERSGEKLWNAGSAQGGSITADMFLKQIVDENVQSMHHDVAGPFWNTEKTTVVTGLGVSTLVDWVLKNASS